MELVNDLWEIKSKSQINQFCKQGCSERKPNIKKQPPEAFCGKDVQL